MSGFSLTTPEGEHVYPLPIRAEPANFEIPIFELREASEEDVEKSSTPEQKPPSASPTSAAQPDKPQADSSPSNTSHFAAETLVNLGIAFVNLSQDLRDDDESPMATEKEIPEDVARKDVETSEAQHASVNTNPQHHPSSEKDKDAGKNEKAEVQSAVPSEPVTVEDWVDTEKTQSDPMNVDAGVV